jgi:acid phosphatase (class A)
VFHFASVLGPRFTAERLPLTTRFFQRVYRSALPHLSATKACWNRPRPFVVDPTLAPLERSLASTKMPSVRPAASSPLPPDSPCTPSTGENAYSYSYPSGHATVGTMMAILLAEIVPERRTALFAAGWEYGEARVISGVHFPSDVEAGRILGTMLIGMLQRDARFRADLHAARQEARRKLGYE